MDGAVYISYLDEPWREIAERLRSILVGLGLQESFKYGLPFFVSKKNVCYINAQKNRVVLGFYYGAFLGHKALQGDGRMVRHLYFYSINDVDVDVIKDVVQSALTYEREVLL